MFWGGNDQILGSGWEFLFTDLLGPVEFLWQFFCRWGEVFSINDVSSEVGPPND